MSAAPDRRRIKHRITSPPWVAELAPRPAQILAQPAQPPVALVAARMQRTALGRRAHRASRLAHVAAIGETAPGSEALHFDEAEGAFIERRGGGRKVAHTGGVDQRGA